MSYTNGLDKPSDYFNTVLYTGDGTSSHAITGVGFQPDWVWLKARSSAYSHQLFDVVRGATKLLTSEATDAEQTLSGVTSFDSDGFTVGSDAGSNNNTTTFASWNWLAGGTASSNTQGDITSTVSANTTSGFSIVSYTGTGSVATVGHGLGVAPKLTIFKRRNNTSNWRVMTTIIDGTHDILYLNATDAKIDASESAPTSSILNLGTGNEVNGSSDTYIAYCFAEKKGFSKFGSYTGNGNSDGTFVYTGFKPAFLITKRTDSSTSGDWNIVDTTRNPSNVVGKYVYANLSNAEATASIYDILSNGFKIRESGAGTNASGSSYIYMCFAESPFTTSTGIPTTAR